MHRYSKGACSVSTLSTVNGQKSPISRSDQGRSDNGVYACAYAYYNKSVHKRGICHMIAESRNSSNVTRPFPA